MQTGYGEREGQQPRVPGLDQPLGTVVAGGVKHALASAVILPATHQGADRVNDPAEPMPTVTAANRGELMVASPMMVGVMTAGCVIVFIVYVPFFLHHILSKTKTPLPMGEFSLSERIVW